MVHFRIGMFGVPPLQNTACIWLGSNFLKWSLSVFLIVGGGGLYLSLSGLITEKKSDY